MSPNNVEVVKRFPKVLYHGTPLKNLKSICEKGILRGTWDRCTHISRDAGFVSDCVGNVSLSQLEKDAIFFAVAATDKIEDHAILHIDTRKLDKTLCFKREIFGGDVGKHEYKCFSDIPPKAITKIRIRHITGGKPFVIDTYKTCKDVE